MEFVPLHPIVCYTPHCTGRAAQYSAQMDGQMGRRILGSLYMGTGDVKAAVREIQQSLVGQALLCALIYRI